MKKTKLALIFLVMLITILACSFGGGRTTEVPAEPEKVADPTQTPAPTPTEVVPPPEEAPQEEPAPTKLENEPVQLTGDIEISNAAIMQIYYFQRFVMLEDLSGFLNRDFEYGQPLEAQILGPVTMDEDGTFSYVLNLPAEPVSPFVDVDNNGKADAGVQVWQVAMNANYLDDPFLDEDEAPSWSPNYVSTRIDSENESEIYGGIVLVWAPDADQAFPIGFGDDGLLFTADDPVDAIPAGYTLVNMDAEPFEFYKEKIAEIPLYEGELTVNDFSEMGWLEGFEALHGKMQLEYPFTELKGLNWQALYDEFAPRIEEAEANNDETAYFLALRDFAWSIPDGHIGLSYGEIGNQMFEEETAGGYGMAVIGLADDRVVVSLVLDEGPAADAGIEWGAEIVSWNGIPVLEALEAVKPWSLPFSTEESKRVQQYRYLLRAKVGTETEVTYLNPGSTQPETVTLTAAAERETFSATSVFAGYDFNALPIEYEILPSGYGYIKINSLSEDINLIIRLWEWALERMIGNQVPGLIIDLRQNTGGSPLGTGFASSFVTEEFELSRTYYYSEKTGDFETYGPPSSIEPDPDLYYDGQLAVLVSTACSSACENVAYVLGELEQTRVFGFNSSNGMYGEVARGQFLLPGGYSFQAPTGMDRDMDGNIIIEGTGVVPDVRVPLTAENVQAQFVAGQDVILDFVVETMDQPIGAGIMPEYDPTIGTVEEAEAALQAQTSFLEELAQGSGLEDANSQPGEIYTITVPLNTSRQVIWDYLWCTADEASFEDNWSKIELAFALNGKPVDIENFAVLEGEFSGSFCRVYYTVLDDWAPGQHEITTTVTFTAPLNDGIEAEDYPAGTHVYKFMVYVAR